MTTKSESQVKGRTNWRRFAAAFVPMVAAGIAMGAMAAHGAVPMSFAISGQGAKIKAKSLHGEGFTQYGMLATTATGDPFPVARAGISKATLVDMCQSVVFPLGPLGEYTLKINAGGGDEPVKATNMFIDMDRLAGDALFTRMDIGIDASTLSKGPKGAQGFQGMFAQQADVIHIDNLQQTMYATQAETFRLTGLNLQLKKGKDECW